MLYSFSGGHFKIIGEITHPCQQGVLNHIREYSSVLFNNVFLFCFSIPSHVFFFYPPSPLEEVLFHIIIEIFYIILNLYIILWSIISRFTTFKLFFCQNLTLIVTRHDGNNTVDFQIQPIFLTIALKNPPSAIRHETSSHHSVSQVNHHCASFRSEIKGVAVKILIAICSAVL